MRRQRQRHLVDGVEQRLLVLLEVAVVGERQALERGEQAGEVADEPTGLAPGQLGDVGVLLLRHHRAAGGVGVVEAWRSRTRRVVHSTTSSPMPREVHADQREGEERLGDEVAVATRRRGCSRSAPAKPRSAATPSGSSGSDDPASAPAPSGDTSARARGVEQPVDVAGQRPAVGEQVVGQQHRLGPLQVRVAGQVGVAGLDGPVEQHLLQRERRARRRRAARASCRAAGRWRPGRCGCGRCGAWRRPGRPAR